MALLEQVCHCAVFEVLNAQAILRIKSKASCVLGGCSPTELYSILSPIFILSQKSLDYSPSNPAIYHASPPHPDLAPAKFWPNQTITKHPSPLAAWDQD